MFMYHMRGTLYTCAVHCTHVLLLIFLVLVINFDLLKILVATLLHSAHSYALLFGLVDGHKCQLQHTHSNVHMQIGVHFTW